MQTDLLDIRHGDCLGQMKTLSDGSVDAIICDPPYGTMKGIEKTGHYGDSSSPKHDWDTTIPHDQLLAQCNRVLRPNGALVLFCQDPFTGKLMTAAHPNLPFSYRLTWLKDTFANPLSAKVAPVNYTEDICVFFKKHTKHDFKGFHPLRPYAAKVAVFIGKSKKTIFKDMGGQGVCHFMRHDSTQFNICTEKTYGKLIELYGIESLSGFMTYSEMAKVDKEYRADLIDQMTADAPKIFNLPENVGHKSNVLRYKKDLGGFHPTQKPIVLMEDLVRTFTRPGDVVLDFTMGSASTGIACIQSGRNFIGFERDPDYYAAACERIERETAQVAFL